MVLSWVYRVISRYGRETKHRLGPEDEVKKIGMRESEQPTKFVARGISAWRATPPSLFSTKTTYVAGTK
ncbi:hypothetical protein J6590_039093 [Homalodisca vitripennis]|nr:hypothetical protein J6590_039093 [Homalodisca vitripennis]